MAYFNRFYPSKKYKWTTYSLAFIKEMIIQRRDNQKDNIILVTGSRGLGKSTFVGKILFQFEDFDPYKSLVYTKEAMFKLVKEKKGYVWGDEAVINVSKGNVMTRGNKFLFELFTINRDNFNTIFLLMPSIEDLDTKILQYVSSWFHIDKRGLAVMFLPNNNVLLGKKKWDIDNMKKIFDEFTKENNQKTSHMPYWVFENFRGYIRFGKLTVDQDKTVKEIKALRKNENLDRQSKDETVIEVKEFENYNKYSAKKLAELVVKGEIRSIETFNKTCEEMKLDPVLMLNKANSVLVKNKIGKTLKGLLKDYDKQDSLMRF